MGIKYLLILLSILLFSGNVIGGYLTQADMIVVLAPNAEQEVALATEAEQEVALATEAEQEVTLLRRGLYDYNYDLGNICQLGYVQCERNNLRTFQFDKRFCNSNAFDRQELLKDNCLSKASYDWRRRTIQCESRFRQCWWLNEDEGYYPFPIR